ncbi:MAG: protein-L-isoaspartate(D-aspartate) O-methyltransferase [DPANN group archaeon]|nr:protein-L-isoaspartate(D-aspartate) O-methyltransferase [DPANN group archaeon]
MNEYSHLISRLISEGHLKTEKIISAFYSVPRIDFLLKEGKPYAYVDEPIPIGFDQTMSAPHMVAIMIELLDLKEGDNVLEIGTGSGWNAAIMSKLVSDSGKIHTVEIVDGLYDLSKKYLKEYKNVDIVKGDGSIGLKEYAPYDKIIVTCAAPKIPEELSSQLKENGLIVIPIGTVLMQELIVGTKRGNAIEKTNYGVCRFVSMKGKSGFK